MIISNDVNADIRIIYLTLTFKWVDLETLSLIMSLEVVQ